MWGRVSKFYKVFDKNFLSKGAVTTEKQETPEFNFKGQRFDKFLYPPSENLETTSEDSQGQAHWDQRNKKKKRKFATGKFV